MGDGKGFFFLVGSQGIYLEGKAKSLSYGIRSLFRGHEIRDLAEETLLGIVHISRQICRND